MGAQPKPIEPKLHALPRVTKRRWQYHRPDTVAQAVAEKWGVTFEALAGWVSSAHVREARADLVRAMRVRTAMSYAEIGTFLGGRDHTTVLYLDRSRR